MTWTALLPALAVVVALGSLTLGLRRVESELISLRVSLRRSGAAAVAADELSRASIRLRVRASEAEADARQRLRRHHRPFRTRSRPPDR